MPDDERLREALLELQLLREREASNHRTTEAILQCVEAVSRARSPRIGLSALFDAIRDVLSADACLLVERVGTAFRGVSSDRLDWVGGRIVMPFNTMRRTRNIADLDKAGLWAGEIDVSGYSAALLVPVIEGQGEFAILCFRRANSFSAGDLTILERVASLAIRAEASLRLETRLRLLAATIEGSSSGFVIADATAETKPLIYVNPAFEALSGYRSDEVLGQNCRFLTAEAPDAPERTRLRAAVARNDPGTFLLRNKRKDGAPFWNELTLYPVRDDAGTPTHLVATQRDVSDRVNAEQDRDRIRTRMEQAVATNTEAFLMLDVDRNVLYANSAMLGLFPAPPHDWDRGTSFAENWAAYVGVMRASEGVISPLLEKVDVEELASLKRGREFDLPDGRSALVRGAYINDGGQARQIIVLWAANVTAIKASQLLLEQRLEAIEAAVDGIAIVDDTGRLSYLNPSAARALGYGAAEDALARKWSRLYEEPPEITAGKGFSTLLKRRNAEAFHEVTASLLAGGGAVLVIRDVTERLAAETREADLQQALSRAQRQEAVSQLAAGIAHDFNNLLSAISGSATLISLDPSNTEDVETHSGRISAAGARAARLVNRLLDAGAPREESMTFDLRAAISDVPDLIATSLSADMSLGLEMGDAPILMRGDPGEINQIVVNMALNARDALGTTPGCIEIALRMDTPITQRPLAVGTLIAGRGYACVRVSDTGRGMDTETREKIFEPYFTTKGNAGTGLGLSTVAALVRASGGGIDVRSEVDVGTTFEVYWPVAESWMSDEPEDAGLPAGALAGLRLILVDDEEEVALVLQGFLERYGAEVVVCPDAELALEAVTEDPDFWSAILTDYDMPGMNGGALVEAVGKTAPRLPVFLVTALARRMSDPRVGPDRVAGIFAKPVDLAQLGQILAQLQPGTDTTEDEQEESSDAPAHRG
ncbi:MAG: PAS domain-containing protein [Pseudomonadota bacterium]